MRISVCLDDYVLWLWFISIAGRRYSGIFSLYPNLLNCFSPMRIMSSLEELRKMIDEEIDPVIVRLMPDRMRYKLCDSYYSETNKAWLIRHGYRWEGLSGFYIPVLETICEPGEELTEATYGAFFGADKPLHEYTMRRFDLCRAIAEEKNKSHMKTRIPGREQVVLDNAKRIGRKAGVDDAHVEAFFRKMMALMSESQEKYRSGQFTAVGRTDATLVT
jgi:chorismate mutase